MATYEEPIGIDQRWSLFENVPTIVDEKFQDSREYATNAYRVAQETIAKLSELAQDLDNIDTNVVLDSIVAPDLDEFVATLPVNPTIELHMPDEIGLSDDVSDAIHDKLLNDLQNPGPAISDAVQTAIFNKDLERSLLIHQDTLDKISEEWAARGFILPDALLVYLLTNAQIEYSNKRLDMSRDIAIKNFELTDTNMKFTIERGIMWISQKIEIYKAKVSAEVSRIEALVKKFIGEVEVYKGSASVYATKVDTVIKVFDVQVRAAIARAELLMKDAEIDMKNYEVVNTLKIKAMEAISGVSAQLVAGALSSVSAGVSLQAQNSASYSYRTAGYRIDPATGELVPAV